MIAKSDQSCTEMGEFSHKKLSSNLSSFFMFFTENTIGKTLHDVVSGSLDSVFDTRCSSNFQVSAILLD